MENQPNNMNFTNQEQVANHENPLSSIVQPPQKNPLSFAVLASVLDMTYFVLSPIGMLVAVFIAFAGATPGNTIASILGTIFFIVILAFPVLPTVLYIISIVKLAMHRITMPLTLITCLIAHLIGYGILYFCLFGSLFADHDHQTNINPLIIPVGMITCAVILGMSMKNLTDHASS